MILMNSFTELISKIGGGVLVMEYGETFGFSDSVRVDLDDSRALPTINIFPTI